MGQARSTAIPTPLRRGDDVSAVGQLARGDTPVLRPISTTGAPLPKWQVALPDFDWPSDDLGTMRVWGRWNQDSLTQVTVVPDHDPACSHTDLKPPCTPPTGGWPAYRVDIDKAFNALDRQLKDEGAILWRTVAGEPGHDVMVVCSDQPDLVEARLRPHLGPSLCVVPVEFSRRDVDVAFAALNGSHEEWLVMGVKQGMNEFGRFRIAVYTQRMTESLAAWLAGQSPGMIHVHPWLRQVST